MGCWPQLAGADLGRCWSAGPAVPVARPSNVGESTVGNTPALDIACHPDAATPILALDRSSSGFAFSTEFESSRDYSREQHLWQQVAK